MTRPTEPFPPIHGARIAHLIESSGPGGAERMVAELAREQSARGWPTTVFLPAHGEEWLTAQLDGTAVAIERYQLETPLSPRCARDIAAAFRRRGISLAHSHEFSMAVYGACAARTVGIPHVITMHGGRYYAEKLRRRLAMRFAVVSSQATVAVSDALAAQMSEDLFVARSQIIVIPNGVRPAAPVDSTLRAELGIPDGTPLILAVGNLYPVKGHRFLLEALALVSARNAHVAIAGRGETEQELRDLAEGLGVADRVHLLGLRGDGPNLLGAADIFAQPSLSEGLPLALLEAMFAGRAIVASDVGDIQRAVGDDAALLVRPGNVEELAAALQRLLDDPALARTLAVRAERRAVRAYGLPTMVDRYAALYAPLLTERRTGYGIDRRVERRVEQLPITLPERRTERSTERRVEPSATPVARRRQEVVP